MYPVRLFNVALLLGLVPLLGACESPLPGVEPTVAGPAERPAPVPAYSLGTEQVHLGFSASVEPVLRVPAGAVIEAFTLEASGGQLRPDSPPGALRALSFGRFHPLTGPVFVEGALPGDVLAVTLHRVEAREWGWVALLPGFGLLSADLQAPFLRTFSLSPGAEELALAGASRVPIRPFPGVMGVAPATDSVVPALFIGAHGGYLANPDLVEGVTVYFPVLVEGALFSIGGGRAAQGGGEVAGVGLEAPLRVVFQLDVVRGAHGVAEPRYEGPDFFAVTASAATLEEAARSATLYLIDFLSVETDLTRTEAYALASLMADLQVSRVAGSRAAVSLRLPKSALGVP